jgi:hypothetical protein
MTYLIGLQLVYRCSSILVDVTGSSTTVGNIRIVQRGMIAKLSGDCIATD